LRTGGSASGDNITCKRCKLKLVLAEMNSNIHITYDPPGAQKENLHSPTVKATH
jgi:hypothetical protein